MDGVKARFVWVFGVCMLAVTVLPHVLALLLLLLLLLLLFVALVLNLPDILFILLIQV